MRRITKKFLLFIFGLLFIVLFCEYCIYYLVIAQCAWPVIQNLANADVLKALIISDTHLLGPSKGHWLDKWRREWQMKQAFHAIITVHEPEVVFVLGDLFDEGELMNDEQFNDYVERFHYLFSVPESIDMYVAAGNHDVDFHNRIRRGSPKRFEKQFKAPSVQHIVIKESHFVILNSMAFEDSCNLCMAAKQTILEVSETLHCSNTSRSCYDIKKHFIQPILMQHFPLFRVSDAKCDEQDSVQLNRRIKKYWSNVDVLSPEATELIISKIKPRAAFGGHTHNSCLLKHSYDRLDIVFNEYSVPSFSWRNRPDPKYMLVAITPTEYAVSMCGLPKEITIAASAVIMLFILLGYLLRMRVVGRKVLH